VTKTFAVIGLLCCWMLPRATEAHGEQSPSHIELHLVVLDEEPRRSAPTESTVAKNGVFTDRIVLLPPEHGVLVAVRMECDAMVTPPCRPGRPIAVLATIDGLKRFIARLPVGSIVEWNPDCVGPYPRLYPLSTADDHFEIERFAAERRVSFVVHRAG
jgi:hypothetical protein